MKKFEHYSFFANSYDDADKTLDECGKEGWEAYAVIRVDDGSYWFHLKRELP